MRRLLLLQATFLIPVLAGCSPPGSSQAKDDQPRPLAKRRDAPQPRAKRKKRPPSRSRLGLSTEVPKQQVLPDVPEPDEQLKAKAGPAAGPGRYGDLSNADQVAQKAVGLISSSLEYGPTLVVWFFDQSPSASGLRGEVARVAGEFYRKQLADAGSEKSKEASDDPRLLSAIVTFGQQIRFLLDEPSGDSAAALKALNSIPADDSGKEMPFAAIKSALARFLQHRKQGREVLFIVVTDEAGDDAAAVEDVLDAPRKYGIPIYVIGPPAPLGRATAGDQAAEIPRDKKKSRRPGVYVRRGPESRYPERVLLELPNGANYAADDVDSGFGPFAWEWLCRVSGGRYLAVRRARTQISLNRGFGWDDEQKPDRPKADDYPYDAAQMRAHAPDYVSDAQYKRILAANAACLALSQAARLPEVASMRNPILEFVAQNGGQLKRSLDLAQTEAARLSPDLDQLYGFLVRGEKDRKNLTSKRWQAQYDLAMGRVLAAKVRVDGYNVMLAALKRGRKFSSPDSKTWVLQPADNLDEAGGKYRTMAARATEYLNRVIKEHPGTPWAEIAKVDLKAMIGWKWSEK